MRLGRHPTESAESAPLQPCCRNSRYARIPHLIGQHTESIEFTPMLYGLLQSYAPSRIHEINQTLFGTMISETPFWGVYDRFECSNSACTRELHVLLIDAQMMQILDQLVRQLYALIEVDESTDLKFRLATEEEKRQARTILSRLVFRTGNAPMIFRELPRNQSPHIWLAEALCIAFVFMVIHETSHQGVQRALGMEYLLQYLPSVSAGAAQLGVTLTEQDQLAWAKELAADLNAFAIMATDARQSNIRQDAVNDWYRAFLVGLILVLKSWDLIIEERCYGDPRIYRRLLRTHPPARWRLDHIISCAETMLRLDIILGDNSWANRVLAALEDLHQ